MNDSLRTNVFVRYHPETIACACIYLSARLLKMPLPNKPPWFLIFNVTEESIQDICQTILCLYARRKTDPEKLEKTVEELRKAHQEAKLKAKGISGNSTPTPKATAEFSPASRHNSPKQDNSPSNIKKEKNGHGILSPKNVKELNHISQLKRKQISPSPSKSPSPRVKKDKSESSSCSVSHSPSPKRRTKTPPRSYKSVHQIRSRSRTREGKESSKHRSYHKRRKSHSHSRSKSRSRSPHRHSKKSYKERDREKTRHVSRSRSRERSHHSNLYEKPHKSRKERNKDVSNHRNHSREHSRR